MDRARQKSNKKLKQMEKEISRVSENHPALLEVEKEYAKYMSMVEKSVEASYKAFQDETDIILKQELKSAYMSKLEDLTTKSKTYKRLVNKITSVLARVNQDALDIVNAQMVGIYADNYNQVAVDCRKAGIKVNGKE